MDWFDPWVRARVAWVVIAVAALPISVSLWLAGGYGLCGTDTVEPPFDERACDWLVRPVAPWALLATTPLAMLLVGGHVALRRRNWRLFAVSVLGAALLLVLGFLGLTAIF